METQWITLLIQAPIVGIFVWFAITIQKNYQASIDKMQDLHTKSMEKRDEAYLEAINRITQRFEAHDHQAMAIKATTEALHAKADLANAKTEMIKNDLDRAIADMKERTRNKPLKSGE